MCKTDLYVVCNEGYIAYVSDDPFDAADTADNLTSSAISDTADEYDWDLTDPLEFDKSVIQNGMDGGVYEVFKIPASKIIEDSDYELPDGSSISINDVLDIYNELAKDYIDNDDDDYYDE